VDDGDCTGYRRVIVKAGKEWRCGECDCTIPKKTLYELASWFFVGESAGQAKTCLVCAEIANAFSCNGRLHNHSLWKDMENIVFPKLTTACFDRLHTPEAKAQLRRRWTVWKGLTI
jgi:hypothetical protein